MATLNLGRLKPVFRSTWNNSTNYNLDDIVVRNNQSYISIQAGTNQDPATATAYWTLMAAKGSDGTDVGATLNNKEIAFKTNAGAVDGIPIGTATQLLAVNSGATGYEFVNQPQGISQTDMWRSTTNSTAAQDPFGATSNLERVDDASFAKIGTGMTYNAGIFSFPVTGLWLCQWTWDMDSSSSTSQMNIDVSTDSGSSYDLVTKQHTGDGQGWYVGSMTQAHVNVTNTSTFRLKFVKTGSSNLYGNTNYNQTFLTFTRLGDSQ
tara:strand:+ start:86 stop:877 length:792 start_codon:yes stop_codon:yes gene_type:complete